MILAGDEDVAIYIKRAATALGWSIPERLAIVCLRDSLALSLPSTSITSVMQPNHELGYQAARLAHRILNGQPVPAEPVQVDTLHLTCRASSIEQGQDLAIERAVKFINENATRGITVSEVMAFQQTSRVTFERLFQASMGCTPGDYIRRIKVQKACELLTQSNQTSSRSAKACGYHSPAKFSSFFKRAMGIIRLLTGASTRNLRPRRPAWPQIGRTVSSASGYRSGVTQTVRKRVTVDSFN